MAWGKAGSTTLTTTGDTITASGITSSETNQTLSHVIQTTTNIRMATRVGNGSIDTGSNYANRSSENGGADSTATSQTYHKNSGSVASDMFAINYAVNVATEEKLFISFNVVRSTAGAGTAPQRMESVGKWANTSNQFDSIETVNDQGGDYTADSNLSVLGSEITPVAAVPAISNVQDNSIFVETDTGVRYWFSAETSNLTFEDDFSSDNWTNSPTGSTWSITSGELQFTNSAGSSEIMYYDLGAGNVSDTKWVLRFRLDIDSWTQGTTASSEWVLFGLSSTTGNSSSTQDSMMCTIRNNSTSESLAITRSNGTNIEGQLGATDLEVLGSTGSFYVEMIRESDSNYTINVRSGSHSGTLLGSQSYTNGSGVAGLRYLKAMNHSSSSTNADSSGGFDDVEFYNNVTSTTTPATWNRNYVGTRALWASGYNGSTWSNVIDYITIDTTGNATDFGDLTVSRSSPRAVSNGNRGIFGGGEASGSYNNQIDYVTIATTGNATDFGDLTEARKGGTATSSDTRGCFAGGEKSGGTNRSNVIDYITMATLGNATDFGDLTIEISAACSADISDNSRGILVTGGNYGETFSNRIDYITIATTGNASDFGDLTVGRDNSGGATNKTRGIIGGGKTGSGSSYTNTIDYITIATTGNATDFGDLTEARQTAGGAGSTTKGIFGGGINTSSAFVNTIDYVTIDTTGNATDFGDLTEARNSNTATSDF